MCSTHHLIGLEGPKTRTGSQVGTVDQWIRDDHETQSNIYPLGLQPPPEKVGWVGGSNTSEPEDMGHEPKG